MILRILSPPPLVERQAARWDPLLDWARARYDVTFAVTTGVMHVAQAPATIARLHEAVAAHDDFHLAGLSPVVTLTGSLVIGLALTINITAPALGGVFVPVTVKRFGFDPALAGGVILTTITDVMGFFTFLGLATLVLLH